ncbi:helix-turn-helix domain-containing protein [Streptomyces sp. NPDC057238]|uniref:helix-turn-helix domain-containing protein n=1 Tax=Streptomyces sp. NPDC057238 TaxID=3346060 RepID=UPI0036363A8E
MEREDAVGKSGPAGPVSVSSDSVSGPDGFDRWGEMVGKAVMPVTMASEHADHFRGEATTLELAHTEASAFSFSPMSAWRTPDHIRRSDPENYYLCLVHGSPIALEQRRNNVLLTAGEMAIVDTSQPLFCDFQDHGRPTRVSLLRLPRAAVPLPGDRTDGLVATRLPAQAGSGVLLASFLTGLRVNAGQFDTTELRRLGAMALELAATFLAARLDLSPPLPVESRQQVLLARIDAFITHNLSDPELSPATIAAHHHISVRLLHALFEEEPETVGATIRRRRLERTRADLADPRLRHRTIGEIALRWGFRHPADFSRTFRRAYGISPSDFRHTA